MLDTEPLFWMLRTHAYQEEQLEKALGTRIYREKPDAKRAEQRARAVLRAAVFGAEEALLKSYNPEQPRAPKGVDTGGQWVSGRSIAFATPKDAISSSVPPNSRGENQDLAAMLPADIGALKFGGVDAKREFHKFKQSDPFYKPNDNFTVDTDTGDVYDPWGIHVYTLTGGRK